MVRRGCEYGTVRQNAAETRTLWMRRLTEVLGLDWSLARHRSALPRMSSASDFHCCLWENTGRSKIWPKWCAVLCTRRLPHLDSMTISGNAIWGISRATPSLQHPSDKGSYLLVSRLDFWTKATEVPTRLTNSWLAESDLPFLPSVHLYPFLAFQKSHHRLIVANRNRSLSFQKRGLPRHLLGHPAYTAGRFILVAS